MAMFGYSGNAFGNPSFGVQAPDLGPAVMPFAATQPQPAAKPSFFAPGGVGRPLVGYLADGLLQMSGNKPIYAPLQAERAKQDDELQRQLALAQYKFQHQEEPAALRTLRGANIDPTSARGQQIVSDSLSRPIWLGNPEMGYTNPEAAPQGPTSQVVNGKTYYNVNGQWYDNPEGR